MFVASDDSGISISGKNIVRNLYHLDDDMGWGHLGIASAMILLIRILHYFILSREVLPDRKVE